MKPVGAMRAADTSPDGSLALPVSSHAATASMRQHGIPFTADNYAVWHCYLTGSNIALKRAIDIVLSNGLAVEERTLRALYARHFCQAGEALALRDLAQRTLQALDGMIASPGAAQAMLLTRLGRDMQEMVQQSERLTSLLGHSAERIAQLERFLDDARQEALTDSLTGVANRRAFDAALRAKAGDAMNEGHELAFLLIDIDRFKQVNDRWGHAVGDDVLRLVAGTLTRLVRGQDTIARYGGEEFAIILPATDHNGAIATAENLRAGIEQQALQLGGGGSLRLTISAGASCYDHGENLGAWLARADAALYVAKNGGRNRVVFGGIMPCGGNVVPLAARERKEGLLL